MTNLTDTNALVAIQNQNQNQNSVLAINSFNTIGDYKIIKKIGEGAMSEVFLAVHSSSTNYVAIKIPRVHIKNQKEYLQRVRREAEILNILNDQRIVKLLSVEESSDSNIFLVQEYVDGKNLEELLECDLKKSRPVVGATIVSEILLGLEEAHRHKIIHRDLKPENIMITSEGRVKITDFGVSKNLESVGHTTTGIIIGSPAYISPEQIKGKDIGPESDLFTLGVILYRYSSGEFPFKGDTYSSLLNSILNNEVVPISKLNPKVHPQLAKIIDKALKKDREKRYRRSYEFRYDLMKYLDHIGAINPTQILKLYFQQSPELDNFAEESLLNTLIVRAESALISGDMQVGVTLVQQALTLDPENQKAKKLLNKNSWKNNFIFTNTFVAVVIFLIAIIIASFVFIYKKESQQPKQPTQPTQPSQPSQPPQLVKSPEVDVKVVLPLPPPPPPQPVTALSSTKVKDKVKVTKDIPISVSNMPSAKRDKKIDNKKEIKEVKPVVAATTHPVSWLILNADNDVVVSIDGKTLNYQSGKPIEVTPGSHSITLTKGNNPPITSSIETIENKTTTINAK
ncbi:MAG: protein kinase [Oligoflexia bacterium]|nr:protein kinase [Oligoflexia bacterium]